MNSVPETESILSPGSAGAFLFVIVIQNTSSKVANNNIKNTTFSLRIPLLLYSVLSQYCAEGLDFFFLFLLCLFQCLFGFYAGGDVADALAMAE